MRRRQINQLRAAGLLPPVEAHLRELWEADRLADRPQPVAAPSVPAIKSAAPAKTCPRCGRAFARGLHFHVRACKA